MFHYITVYIFQFQETGSWEEAFFAVIPKRKVASESVRNEFLNESIQFNEHIPDQKTYSGQDLHHLDKNCSSLKDDIGSSLDNVDNCDVV